MMHNSDIHDDSKLGKPLTLDAHNSLDEKVIKDNSLDEKVIKDNSLGEKVIMSKNCTDNGKITERHITDQDSNTKEKLEHNANDENNKSTESRINNDKSNNNQHTTNPAERQMKENDQSSTMNRSEQKCHSFLEEKVMTEPTLTSTHNCTSTSTHNCTSTTIHNCTSTTIHNCTSTNSADINHPSDSKKNGSYQEYNKDMENYTIQQKLFEQIQTENTNDASSPESNHCDVNSKKYKYSTASDQACSNFQSENISLDNPINQNIHGSVENRIKAADNGVDCPNMQQVPCLNPDMTRQTEFESKAETNELDQDKPTSPLTKTTESKHTRDNEHLRTEQDAPRFENCEACEFPISRCKCKQRENDKPHGKSEGDDEFNSPSKMEFLSSASLPPIREPRPRIPIISSSTSCLPEANVLTKTSKFENPFIKAANAASGDQFLRGGSEDLNIQRNSVLEGQDKLKTTSKTKIVTNENTSFSLKGCRYYYMKDSRWSPTGGIYGEAKIYSPLQKQKSTEVEPHRIVFHQDGRGSIRLNTEIYENFNFKLLGEKSVVFMGRNIDDPMSLRPCRITFPGITEKNNFLEKFQNT